MFNTEQEEPGLGGRRGGCEVWPHKCFFFNDTFSPGLLSIENATGNFVSAKKNSWSNKWTVSITNLNYLRKYSSVLMLEAREVLFTGEKTEEF